MIIFHEKGPYFAGVQVTKLTENVLTLIGLACELLDILININSSLDNLIDTSLGGGALLTS